MNSISNMKERERRRKERRYKISGLSLLIDPGKRKIDTVLNETVSIDRLTVTLMSSAIHNGEQSSYKKRTHET